MRLWVRSLLRACRVGILCWLALATAASAQTNGFVEGRDGIFELVLPIFKQRHQLAGASWQVTVTRDGDPFCHLRGKLNHEFLDPGHTPDKRFLVCPVTASVTSDGSKSLYRLSFAIDSNSDGTVDDTAEYARDVVEEKHLGKHPFGCIVTLYLGFVANEGAKSVFLVSDSEQTCG